MCGHCQRQYRPKTILSVQNYDDKLKKIHKNATYETKLFTKEKIGCIICLQIYRIHVPIV